MRVFAHAPGPPSPRHGPERMDCFMTKPIAAALACCALLTTLLAGCRVDGRAPESQLPAEQKIANDTSQAMALTADGPITIEAMAESTVVKDADGTVLANVTYTRAQLVGSTKGVAALNQLGRQEQDDYLAQAEKAWLNRARESRAALGSAFEPYTIESTYEATYNSAGLLSVLRTEYCNVGAPAPMLRRSSRTFLLTDGREVAATELLELDEAGLRQMIQQEFAAQIAQAPENYHPDAAETLAKAVSSAQFYMAGTELRFYLPQETIAPQSAGFPEFGIPYENDLAFRFAVPVLNMDALPLKSSMKEIYDQVVPTLPPEERTDVRMVSEGEGEVGGESIYIIKLYLPTEQVIGYYGVGQDSQTIYQRDGHGSFQHWEP